MFGCCHTRWCAGSTRGSHDGLVGVGAHLELLRTERAVQQLGTVEFGGLRDAVQFDTS